MLVFALNHPEKQSRVSLRSEPVSSPASLATTSKEIMMPATWPQWLFFGYYTLGSAGGLVVLVILCAETWRGWRK